VFNLAVFKFVISQPETRKSFQLEVDQSKALGLVGKKIDEEFNGDTIGLPGYTLKITGGTDKDGFPMYSRVKGLGKRKILLSSPPCYHPKMKGQRKRKMVRGNTISEDIVQINCKVIKKGEKLLEELVPKKPKEKKEKPEEKPPEKPKKEVKEEKKSEEPKKEPEKKEEKRPEEKPKEAEKKEEKAPEGPKEETKEKEVEKKEEKSKEEKLEPKERGEKTPEEKS
jgi:small subunit ribosomal protein S6e